MENRLGAYNAKNVAKNINKIKMTNHKVVIYSTPVCVYCKIAKDFFKQNNVVYEEKNVATDDVAREEMFAVSKQMGVPVIVVDGAHVVVGFDKPVLTKLLEIGAASVL